MDIENPSTLRESHELFCKSLNLLGKVIIAPEGINGCLSGNDADIDTYANHLINDLRIAPEQLKITPATSHTFKKMWVKLKPQIIKTGWDANIQNKGAYLEPEELKKMFDKNEEFYIIDGRNNYEYEVGHFKNAISPSVRKFTEFHEFVKSLEHLKDKKVVTFCTGGIRCEKASAYLKEQGFKHVYQLHGGIVNYGKKFGSAHWKGKCFVFDNRTVLDLDAIKE